MQSHHPFCSVCSGWYQSCWHSSTEGISCNPAHSICLLPCQRLEHCWLVQTHTGPENWFGYCPVLAISDHGTATGSVGRLHCCDGDLLNGCLTEHQQTLPVRSVSVCCARDLNVSDWTDRTAIVQAVPTHCCVQWIGFQVDWIEKMTVGWYSL